MLRAEERAGRALYGGIMTPAFVDQGLLGPDPDPGWPIKLDAFINIVRHADRYLALEEGTPPYEVSSELETIGRFDFGGGLPLGMCAHPRIDPRTGEMVMFRYDVSEPYLTWAAVGPDGSLTRPPAAATGVDKAFMIHDFTITEHYVLFVIGPVSFAELGPFRVWHFANAYEDGDRVVADFPSWSELSLAAGDRRAADGRRAPVSGQFSRVTIDPARGTASVTRVGDQPSEFPRIDDRPEAAPTST